MFPGINPELIKFAVKGKLDDILNGKAPEGLKIVEQTPEKVVLVPSDATTFDFATVNRIDVSITYEGKEIILRHA